MSSKVGITKDTAIGKRFTKQGVGEMKMKPVVILLGMLQVMLVPY